MTTTTSPVRVHVIAGGYPPGAAAGHDHDYARLQILNSLHDMEARATVAGDFTDVEKWLRGSQFLVTYVAGPYMGDEQNRIVREWLDAGGRWLALHGTSGGKAARTSEGRRRMVKMSHHETLGSFFINHPPVRKFRVTVVDDDNPLTRGLPESFEVVDEPYMIELQQPSTTQVLLTSALGPDASPPGFGFQYDEDTSLLPDGTTRVVAYTRPLGAGGVTYTTLGHCHTPATNSQPFVDPSVDASGVTPKMLRGSWESDAYRRLLSNSLEWGLGRD